MQFYEMASFFGATTTRLTARDMKNKEANPMTRLMAGIGSSVDTLPHLGKLHRSLEYY